MSAIEVVRGLSDQYDRQARLYPALLASAPLVIVAVCLYSAPLQPKSGAVALLASFGIFYLLCTLSRELGKRQEASLFASWGGKPTTQLLRHRDTTLDSVTKNRYHLFLSTKLVRAFPTLDGEAADPSAADELYGSGSRWLLDETRDKKQFALLFKELIAYGFRRNCLGMKPIAIAIASAALVWVLAAAGILKESGIDLVAIAQSSMAVRVALSVNLILLVIWIFFITKRTVRTSAFTYADLLLRACDRL